MEWIYLAGKLVPRLNAFDDGWKVLASFNDVISKLAEVDDQNITEEEFVKILDQLGFKDLTSY
jgi:hypothetical protein